MLHHQKAYVAGHWTDPIAPRMLDVTNPATEEPIATIAMGSEADVDAAVAAARAAFPRYSASSQAERIELLESIVACYRRRMEDLATTLSAEMGAPIKLSRESQVTIGLGHLAATLQALRDFAFDTYRGSTCITREAIGAVGLITPWNWPLNQIACKVAPALAAGCTMVLKPSELAPLTAV